MENKDIFLRWFILSVFVCVIMIQPHVYANVEQSYKTITTNELVEMIDSKARNYLIIDARNPEEYEDVHIPDAINIPDKKFDKYVGLLPGKKDVQLVFYCNGVKCGKSKRAAKKAMDLEYMNVFVYAEGMPVWEEFGLPKVTGPNYETKIETAKISPTELNLLVNSKMTDFTIVDVRDVSEFNEGHIPGAINIPVASFAARSGELNKKNTIIVYCNAGNRSYKAYRKLMKLAYKKNYQALFADWKTAGYHIDKMPL